ncbi:MULTISPECIES: hypothetical protein [unclassified Streptomyces]|uniref:hypothetical protein n=1 Tax=unclassified Streptomyces TaxID=2593676 RepID=UPI00380EA786
MNAKIGTLLGVAAERTVTVVRGVTDDQPTAPTPCALIVYGWERVGSGAGRGQPYEPDATLVGAVGAEFRTLAPTARKTGVFGEPVPVAEDAEPFDALLALTGRDPGWSRP